MFIIVGEGGMGVPPSSYDFFFLETFPLKTDALYGVPSIKNEALQLKNKPPKLKREAVFQQNDSFKKFKNI